MTKEKEKEKEKEKQIERSISLLNFHQRIK
jgi:hypothetical protein